MKIKLRLLNNSFVLVLIILPFFWPAAFSELFPSIDIVHDILRISSFAAIFAIFIADRRLSKIIIAVFAYEATLLFSTLINNGDYWNLAVECGSVLAVCMFVDLMSVRNARAMVKAFLYLFAAEVIANLITVIAFPEGMYKTPRFWQNWLLGYDNTHYTVILPLLCVFAVWAERSNIPTITQFLIILLFSVSVFITWSGASMVAVTVWVILWIVTKTKAGANLLNVRRIVLLHGGFFFLIVIGRMQYLFKWLIVDVLRKNLTFNGRTSRWDIVLEMFRYKPLLGWGVVDTELTRTRLAGLSHCHNHFLQILYESGLFGMVFFLAAILILDRPLKKVRNRKYSAFFLITILCFFMVGQVEAITNMTSLFAIVTMAYHAPQIESALESDKRRSRVRFVLKREKTQLAGEKRIW